MDGSGGGCHPDDGQGGNPQYAALAPGLDQGYTIAGVRPIIKTVVDGNGDVTTKATDAIVMLGSEDTTRASVWVDIEEGKVTQIVILTRTVIEKS